MKKIVISLGYLNKFKMTIDQLENSICQNLAGRRAPLTPLLYWRRDACCQESRWWDQRGRFMAPTDKMKHIVWGGSHIPSVKCSERSEAWCTLIHAHPSLLCTAHQSTMLHLMDVIIFAQSGANVRLFNSTPVILRCDTIAPVENMMRSAMTPVSIVFGRPPERAAISSSS